MSKEHDWGPSSLNHGTRQCKNCLCTWEEHEATKRLFGEDCPKAPEDKPNNGVLRHV